MHHQANPLRLPLTDLPLLRSNCRAYLLKLGWIKKERWSRWAHYTIWRLKGRFSRFDYCWTLLTRIPYLPLLYLESYRSRSRHHGNCQWIHWPTQETRLLPIPCIPFMHSSPNLVGIHCYHGLWTRWSSFQARFCYCRCSTQLIKLVYVPFRNVRIILDYCLDHCYSNFCDRCRCLHVVLRLRWKWCWKWCLKPSCRNCH